MIWYGQQHLLTLMVSSGWPESTLQMPPNPPVIKDLSGFALRSAGALSTLSTDAIFDQQKRNCKKIKLLWTFAQRVHSATMKTKQLFSDALMYSQFEIVGVCSSFAIIISLITSLICAATDKRIRATTSDCPRGHLYSDAMQWRMLSDGDVNPSIVPLTWYARNWRCRVGAL